MSATSGADSENTLTIVTNGEVVGDIQRNSTRRMRLRYTGAGTKAFTPLSVMMPGSRGRHREAVLSPWLDGLLPDRPETLRQWRRRFSLGSDLSTFSLLRYVGEDVAGAAQFVRPERIDAVLSSSGAVVPVSRTDVADMLRRAMADLPVSSEAGPEGKFSLAGAQAKIAVQHDGGVWSNPHGSSPSTHILKPAIPGMEDQDLVEAVTMGTARRLGLRAARVRSIPSMVSAASSPNVTTVFVYRTAGGYGCTRKTCVKPREPHRSGSMSRNAGRERGRWRISSRTSAVTRARTISGSPEH